MQDVVKVLKSIGHRVAMLGGGDKADVVDDRGSYKIGKSASMASKDIRESDYKEKGAKRVTLSYPFM